MLVLSRKEGEQIRIGAGIEVTVLSIRKGRVRLGFSGPPEVRIHRQELYQRLQACSSEPLEAVPTEV
ncbi:MAG: carbon storage regulator CsrA [Planctomycetota bacterium]|jgi:carbon storage regulator